ncbi:unnamed protein product [Protopolystoma xenopodis]|uniref:Uncharacterized protein n=1 Tax=Protopolystoma xenopodis TaxID=117903 RepID=A0A448XMV3_9PLAT|nr:unnamed protein product [Protopolystoma xenopodis]
MDYITTTIDVSGPKSKLVFRSVDRPAANLKERTRNQSQPQKPGGNCGQKEALVRTNPSRAPLENRPVVGGKVDSMTAFDSLAARLSTARAAMASQLHEPARLRAKEGSPDSHLSEQYGDVMNELNFIREDLNQQLKTVRDDLDPQFLDAAVETDSPIQSPLVSQNEEKEEALAASANETRPSFG